MNMAVKTTVSGVLEGETVTFEERGRQLRRTIGMS